MKKNKQPTSFSLTPEAKNLLWQLSKRKGLSATATLETLIRQEAARCSIAASPKPLAQLQG